MSCENRYLLFIDGLSLLLFAGFLLIALASRSKVLFRTNQVLLCPGQRIYLPVQDDFTYVPVNVVLFIFGVQLQLEACQQVEIHNIQAIVQDPAAETCQVAQTGLLLQEERMEDTIDVVSLLLQVGQVFENVAELFALASFVIA